MSLALSTKPNCTVVNCTDNGKIKTLVSVSLSFRTVLSERQLELNILKPLRIVTWLAIGIAYSDLCSEKDKAGLLPKNMGV
jgi:hypothetical protein